MSLKIIDKKKRLLVQFVDALSYIGYNMHTLFTKKRKQGPIKKVLVYNVGLIGDTILSLSTLDALQRKFKDITVVTGNESILPHYKTIKFSPSWIANEKNQYFNWKDFKEGLNLIKKIEKEEFDLAIDLRADIRNLAILYLTKIPHRVGYAITGGKHFLTSVVPYVDCHEVEKKLNIARHLGCKIDKPAPVMKEDATAKKKVDQLFKKAKINKSHTKIVIIPSAGYSTKLWTNDKWTALINKLTKKDIVRVILLGAPADEKFSTILEGVDKHQVLNWIGELPLLQSAAVIKKADLVISPDNGVMHMATALGTPTLSLFGPTLPDRWGPIGAKPKDHQVIYKNWHCSPCGRINSCPYNNECMTNIEVSEVLKKVKNANRINYSIL